MTMTNSRLLLEINKTIKDVNRDIINPMFDELSKGSQALETAIERGYLDVQSS